jgi:hypothetical protein
MIWIIPDSDNEPHHRAGDGAPSLFIGYLEYAHCFSPAPITSIGNAVLIVGRGFGADNLHLRPTAGAFHDGKRV